MMPGYQRGGAISMASLYTRTEELIKQHYPEFYDEYLDRRSLINRKAEAISEEQACGSCGGCTETSDHCLSCTVEALEQWRDEQ